MEPFEPSPLEPTVIGAAWRFRWLVVVLTVLGAVSALLVALTTSTERYEAVSSMVVEDPRSSILFDVGQRQRRQDYVADQIEILRSGAIAVRAADIARQQGVDLTAGELLDDTEIIGDQDSSLIFIRVTADSPEEATEGANAMIEAYQTFLQAETEATFASSIQVLEDTIDQLETEAAAVRDAIVDATTGDSPDRVRLDAQFEAAIPRLADLLERLPNATGETRDNVRAQINDILLQFQVIGTVDDLETNDPALADLLAQQSRISQRIDDLAERRDRIRLDSRLLSSGVTAAIPAFEAREVSANIPRTLIVGLLLGLMAGLAAAYALALRRRNFTERSQPELILDAPLIAEVPTFKQEGIKDPLPVRSVPKSASAEAFRFAATALALADEQVIAVVSASLGEGKTVVAANTALAAAREGNRVLLIDADFGNQMATELLAPGVRPVAGITEVVEQGTGLPDAVIDVEGTGGGGLHLLARGWRQTTAPEFFRLPATRAFLQRIKEFYDLVLIDAPPLLQVAYASTVAGLSDGVLIVVPHESSLAAAEEMQDRLDLIGTNSVGYVYNLAPLRLEMTRTEGSMKDVLGDGDVERA